MKHRVELMAERLTAILASWPGVSCVLSCDASETDILDPYFALVLDVYCDEAIPSMEQRIVLFDNPGAFEGTPGGNKDRFFLDGLPIHLEYKKTALLNFVLMDEKDLAWIHSVTGTYFLYRIVHGSVLYRKNDWIDRVRAGLEATPAYFWTTLRETWQFKMEHHLSDLGGAALKNDRYFYYISLAGFMKACASILFAINKAWEPSDRNLTEALLKLPLLPDDFSGQWGGLTRTDSRLSPERIFQLAQHTAKSIFLL